MASHRTNNFERRAGAPDIPAATDIYDAPVVVNSAAGDKLQYNANGTIYDVLAAPSSLTPAGLLNNYPGVVICKQALFTEDATSLTHTATIAIPAGATLVDIIVTPQVLWTATGAVKIDVGDANAATGWFAALDLKATDLVLGERLQASGGTRGWGGKPGAYLDNTSGRFGQQSTNMIGGYCPTAYSVIGVVTVVTPATTAGRTRMSVYYSIGTPVTPVLA